MRTELHAPAELPARAATWLAEQAWRAIALRGEAHVAVSGGTTPAAMLVTLATLPLPFARLHLWQVDERVAPDGDASRNLRLLEPVAAAGAVVHPLVVTAADLTQAAQDYADELRDRCGGSLDAVHLGLGDDGHTASWAPGWELETDPAATGDVAVSPPYRGQVRLTLTPAAVNRARRIVVLVDGAAKADALARFLARDPRLPASRLRVPGVVVLTDPAAAGR
jgi:6-phosphogluconolactonase/glucosamine-6-phosphate isomerase/deaminase